MTSIDGARAPKAHAYEVVPVAAAEPRAVALPPVTAVPTVVNRETVAHGLFTLGSFGALGAATFMGSASASLVAMGAAAVASLGVTVWKLSRGHVGGPTRELVASLKTEREALADARGLLKTELSALTVERGALSSERAQLEAERTAIAQRVATEAERIVGKERQAIASERAALDQERARMQEAQSQASAQRAAEAKLLTPEQLTAIADAVEAYARSSNEAIYRIVGEVHRGYGVTSPSEHMIAKEKVVATLVGTGKVVAGPCIVNADTKYVVPADGATIITSVGQLRDFLRIATGRDV